MQSSSKNTPEIVTGIAADKGAIQAAIKTLAGKLKSKLSGSSAPVVAVIVLEGARRFATDLLAQLHIKGIDVDQLEIGVKSYHGGTESTGSVEIDGTDIGDKVSGANVLLLDDIYDTGRTITALKKMLLNMGASEITTCVLLEKTRKHERPTEIDLVGLKMPDRFLIGYGLDYKEKYRELDYIAFADNAV